MKETISFRKIGLLVLSLLIFQSSFSQENYLPGYVIKTDADTLSGFIDYRNWEKNPDKINFVTQLGENPSVFTFHDISEFKVGGEIYVSGIVDIEVSPIQIEHLSESAQIQLGRDTTFLQTLVKGPKSLYYFRHPLGRDYFYIDGESGYELLLYKKYVKKNDGNPKIIESKKYAGQLTLYLNDCESIRDRLTRVSYKKKSLSDLFQAYYKCTGSELTFEKEIEKGHTEWGIFTGVDYTSVDFQGNGFLYLTQGNFNTSIYPTAGLFLNFVLPRNQGKLSVQSELQFSSYSVEGTYDEYISENQYSSFESKISNSYLKLNILLKYKFPVGSSFLFVNGGASNGFVVSQTNLRREDKTFYQDHKINEGPAIEDPRKYEQSFILGAGVMKNRFSFEGRFERGNGMSKWVSLGHLANRYYFLIGYRL